MRGTPTNSREPVGEEPSYAPPRQWAKQEQAGAFVALPPDGESVGSALYRSFVQPKLERVPVRIEMHPEALRRLRRELEGRAGWVHSGVWKPRAPEHEADFEGLPVCYSRVLTEPGWRVVWRPMIPHPV